MKKIIHIIIALFTVVLVSCFDPIYHAFISNETDDTLFMLHPMHYVNSSLDTITLNPQSRFFIYQNSYTIIHYLKRNSMLLDTIRIYRKDSQKKDSLVIEWYPPLRRMSKRRDSTSFYNENSWEHTVEGRVRPYDIETLTITDEVYGHAF